MLKKGEVLDLYYKTFLQPYRSKLERFPLPVTRTLICGLYYKHMTIVNGESSIVIKCSFKLIDNTRGVIYDRHVFIIQANDIFFKAGVY